MTRLILSLLLLVNLAYASSQRYYIQFGSFKNLQGLKKNIRKMPKSLRSHVKVVKRKGWYVPFAYYTTSKRPLYSKLSSYKRYFHDAHINHSAYMLNNPVILNYSKKKSTTYVAKPVYSEKIYYQPSTEYTAPVENTYQNTAISSADNTVNAPLQFYTPPSNSFAKVAEESFKTVATKDGERKKYTNFSKKMLSGETYYLAYKSTEDSPNLLIKVTFENHNVIYQPIIGDMQMSQANYLVENQRLYMFANAFTKNGNYSTLEEHRKNHFLVSSWINGKKLNTLRYYYHLNDAKKYLGYKTSEELATALQEGKFDQLFEEE